LSCVGDRQGMDGAGGIRMAGGDGVAPDSNIGGGFLMAAREFTGNGSVTRVVAMVTCCCCEQVSTFQGREWVLSGTKAITT